MKVLGHWLLLGAVVTTVLFITLATGQPLHPLMASSCTIGAHSASYEERTFLALVNAARVGTILLPTLPSCQLPRLVHDKNGGEQEGQPSLTRATPSWERTVNYKAQQMPLPRENRFGSMLHYRSVLALTPRTWYTPVSVILPLVRLPS